MKNGSVYGTSRRVAGLLGSRDNNEDRSAIWGEPVSLKVSSYSVVFAPVVVTSNAPDFKTLPQVNGLEDCKIPSQ